MRFKKLLIHRCMVIREGPVKGRDPYGRDIRDQVKDHRVPCRFDQIKTALSFDQNGVDIITRNLLYFDHDVKIDINSKIEDVKDLNGNMILEGTYTIMDLLPIYRKDKLHHYEIEVQKE